MNFDDHLIEGEDIDNLEEVKKAKLWMFQEQIKIQAKKDELLEYSKELFEEKKSLERERRELNIHIEAEKKRSYDTEVLIAKKLKALEDAYEKLNYEKKALECERLNFEYERRKLDIEKRNISKNNKPAMKIDLNTYDGLIFFRVIDNQLALRKRYKDLMKIFHPDNRCGDTTTLQRIQMEYDSFKKEYYEI